MTDSIEYDDEEAEEAKERVAEWMHRGGDVESDADFVLAVSWIVRQWWRHKSDCMDVLASSYRDQLAELVEAMDDLI